MSFRHPFFAGLLFVSGFSLVASPDPDLFDGRVSQSSAGLPTSNHEETGDESAGEGSVERSGKMSESRDYSQFDGTDVGQKVAVGDSKSDHIEQVISANASGVVLDKTEAHGLKGGEGEFSAETERSFEEFEIGSYGKTEAAIEVNRSKRLTEVSSSQQSDSTVSSEPATKSSGADKNVIQEQTRNRGDADFGSDLPSGL